MRVNVHNMTSPSTGNAVPNQFSIEVGDENGTDRFFQSYDTVIARIDKDGQVYLDERNWNYSVTTSKYRNRYLGLTTEETKARIKSGRIILADLNKD